MQIIDVRGKKLDTMSFIDIFRVVRKTAPARFLVLILHPDRYKDIETMAAPPECVELGSTIGPLGRPIMRVICVKPAQNVSDGVAIRQDAAADPTRLVFQLHGIDEIIVENIGE